MAEGELQEKASHLDASNNEGQWTAPLVTLLDNVHPNPAVTQNDTTTPASAPQQLPSNPDWLDEALENAQRAKDRLERWGSKGNEAQIAHFVKSISVLLAMKADTSTVVENTNYAPALNMVRV